MREGDTVNVFDRAVAAVAPVHAAKRAAARAALKIIDSGYGNYGANLTKKSLRGWEFYGGSAKEDIEDNIDILRQRSRDAYMGIPTASAALKTMRTNVIAGGLMPAPQIDAEFLGLTPEDAEKLQAQIVREFALWADTPVCDADRVDNFYKLQQLTFLSYYTAGVTSKPGSAAGTASYFGGTSKQVSADFIVDDGGAVQYNGDIRNRYTWHCGGGKYNTKGGAYYGKATNRNTIGIEVCSTNDTGKMTVANDSHWRFTDKVVSNLVELVKYLMAEYGIDAAHVIRHYDVNGKPCPGIIGWNEDTGSAAKWAAFKARLGAATPGGQTGGSTNTGTATGNTALTYKVGDIVQFAGGKHYANAQAASGTTVKPGPAKVTAVATAGKHPYHLVHTDSTSTVYGWVDAAAITGKASATPAAKTYTVKAGDSLWRIAAQQLGNGARYKEIKTLNGLKNNTIHAGQVLKLPN